MKNLILRVLCAAILLPIFFTACQREPEEGQDQEQVQEQVQEGVYNPQKKIDRIYTEWQYYNGSYSWDIPKHLSEVWEWDGNKLSSIIYYDESGQYWGTATFTYQDNRIVSLSVGNGNETAFCWFYSYQNGLLTSMTEYRDNEQTATINFIHSGKDIIRISHTRHDLGKDRKFDISPLRFILPSVDADSYCKFVSSIGENNVSKGWDGTYVYELQWENGNLVNLVSTHNALRDVRVFKYDVKNNPFHNSFLGRYYPVDGAGNLTAWCFPTSKNNVVEERQSDSNGYESTYSYMYVYDGKYPIVQEKTMQHFTIHGVLQNWSKRSVVYYEYK